MSYNTTDRAANKARAAYLLSLPAHSSAASTYAPYQVPAHPTPSHSRTQTHPPSTAAQVRASNYPFPSTTRSTSNSSNSSSSSSNDTRKARNVTAGHTTSRSVPTSQLSPRALAFLGPRKEFKYEGPDDVGLSRAGTKVTLIKSAPVQKIDRITLPHFAGRSGVREVVSDAGYKSYIPPIKANSCPPQKRSSVSAKILSKRDERVSEAVAIPFSKPRGVPQTVIISKPASASASKSKYNKNSLAEARVCNTGRGEVKIRVVESGKKVGRVEVEIRPVSSKGVICGVENRGSIASYGGSRGREMSMGTGGDNAVRRMSGVSCRTLGGRWVNRDGVSPVSAIGFGYGDGEVSPL